MAAAFLEELAGGKVEVDSAGTQPSDAVNPAVVEVMKEKGIDVLDNKPKLLTQDMADKSDKVFTMGCSIEEACPTVFVPSGDWGLEDPRGKPVEVVRRIRDQVEERVKAMIPVLSQ